MSFYNKKEEVIDIQLTQYGRLALATGKFRPHYYAFYDDDIIYDMSYANTSELQSNIQGRILTSARKQAATSIYGSETKVLETNQFGHQSDGLQQLSPNEVDKELLLRNMMLHNSAAKDTLPELEIDISNSAEFLKEEGITKTTGSYSTTTYYNIKAEVKSEWVQTHAGGVYVPQDQGLVITLKEGHDFCSEDEYEISLYEIDRSSPEQSLKSLYFQSSEPHLSRATDRFVIYMDDQVPTQHVSERLREDCESTTFNYSPSSDTDKAMKTRDIYEKMDFEMPKCDEGGE